MTIVTYGLVDDDEIELDVAALVLSELDHPGADLAPYIALLHDIDERLRVAGVEAHDGRSQAAALAGVFHGEFGFEGDADTYDVPLNGDMIRVLDRRRGLPVSLSILYVAAARRMGWRADALNTPGHVLVRVGADKPVIIDPFNTGEIVSDRQLSALLQGVTGSNVEVATDIGPMNNRAILVRLLINQASRAENAGDLGRAMTIYQRMTLIAPSNSDAWWALARLQLGSGMIDKARASLSAMLEVTRDSTRREIVIATIEAIAGAE